MKRIFVSVLVLTAILNCQFAFAKNLDIEKMRSLAARFPYAIVLNPEDPQHLKFIYTDVMQHVHIYHVEKKLLVLEWETTNLGSKVTALFVHDLFNDGSQEMVIATEAGRILIYGMDDYELIWENLQDPFDKIECMNAADIDRDPQEEIIFVADSNLYIYDSLTKSLEWQSQEDFTAKEILLANVDDDEQLEIILNTGSILDSRFFNVEFQNDKNFGERISLFDINDDGIDEIFGEFPDFTLRIYDIYAEREIW